LHPAEDVFHCTLGKLSFTEEYLEGETIAPPLDAPEPSCQRDHCDPAYREVAQRKLIYISEILKRYIASGDLENENCIKKEPPIETEASIEGPELGHRLTNSTKANDSPQLLTPFQGQSIVDVDVTLIPSSKPYSTKDFSFNLPQIAVRQNTFLSFIRPHIDDEWLKVVWNKGLQANYSILDVSSRQLPVMIERKRPLADSQMGVEDERQAKRFHSSIWPRRTSLRSELAADITEEFEGDPEEMPEIVNQCKSPLDGIVVIDE